VERSRPEPPRGGGLTPVRRLFLSATLKSSGKTTLAIGIAAAFSRRGAVVQTFKKGPDYIDPMWLSRASGRPCYNLDFNTQTSAEILATFGRNAQGAGLSLIEGNKGLHDGVDVEGADSSAALAKLLGAPVVLVVDTCGMARGIAPLVLGYAAFDREVRIAGVILNKVGSERQAGKLRRALERYTDIPVLGALGRDRGIAVRERHLGLTTPGETAESDAIIESARRAAEDGLDLARLAEIAAQAPAAPEPASPLGRSRRPDVRIAIARDEAFGFYYQDDLEAFGRAGAKLVFFDALRDERLPDCDGLFIGGGFPETHAARLSANAPMRDSIRKALAGGLPAYAECGGLMYLSRSVAWGEARWPMVGAVPADARMNERPQGRGLVVLEETGEAPWSVGRGPFPAHEFHHAALEGLAPGARFGYRVRRGSGIDGRRDGVVIGSLMAGFSHLRNTLAYPWVERFVAHVRSARPGASAIAAKTRLSSPPAIARARVAAPDWRV
jgi:cobyrinic acid a,c-diamide synthase